jgi:hypothetical protein
MIGENARVESAENTANERAQDSADMPRLYPSFHARLHQHGLQRGVG